LHLSHSLPAPGAIGDQTQEILMKKLSSILAVAMTALSLTTTPAMAMGSDPAEKAEENYQDAVRAVKNENYDDAIDKLKEVLDHDSRNADALNYMGYSYRKLGKYEQAFSFYTRALKLDPDHKGANEYIGDAYLERNMPEKAKIHLDRLAKICSSSCEEYAALKKAWDTWQAKQKRS
jgi:tetratricopeptide (TPR) repeat protein